MKLGVLTSGVDQDLERALARIAQDGFSHVEIQSAWCREDGDRTPAQELEVRRLLARYGVRCTAVMRNLLGAQLAETELDSPAYIQALHDFRTTIALARQYGCTRTRVNSFDRQTVLFGSGGAENYVSGGNWAWKKYLRLMEPFCRIAQEENITIMVETGTGGLIHSAALARKAIDALQCPNFQVLWDPANCLYSGEAPIPDGYEHIRGHIAEIHIKDLRFERPLDALEYCLLGQGVMAPYLEPLAEMLRRDGYTGAIILENQVTPPGGLERDGYAASAPVFQRIFGNPGKGGKTVSWKTS